MWGSSQQQLRNNASGSVQRAGSMQRSESALTVGRVNVLTLYAELLLFLFTMRSVFWPGSVTFRGDKCFSLAGSGVMFLRSQPKSSLPCEQKVLRNTLSSCRKLKLSWLLWGVLASKVQLQDLKHHHFSPVVKCKCRREKITVRKSQRVSLWKKETTERKKITVQLSELWSPHKQFKLEMLSIMIFPLCKSLKGKNSSTTFKTFSPVNTYHAHTP